MDIIIWGLIIVLSATIVVWVEHKRRELSIMIEDHQSELDKRSKR